MNSMQLKKIMVVAIILALLPVIASAGEYVYFIEVISSDATKTGTCWMKAETGEISVDARASADDHGEVGEAVAWVLVEAGYEWEDEGTPTGGTFEWSFDSDHDTGCNAIFLSGEGDVVLSSWAESYAGTLAYDYTCHIDTDAYIDTGEEESDATLDTTFDYGDWTQTHSTFSELPGIAIAGIKGSYAAWDPCSSYGQETVSAGDGYCSQYFYIEGRAGAACIINSGDPTLTTGGQAIASMTIECNFISN